MLKPREEQHSKVVIANSKEFSIYFSHVLAALHVDKQTYAKIIILISRWFKNSFSYNVNLA